MPHRERGCRELAAEILFKVDTRKAFADILLDHSLKRFSLPARDRALLTQLVYGTLRWRGTIDWYLSQTLRRPLARTNPYVRNILRLTLYQLLFLDRVPDYAAVDEGVELAKRFGGAKTGSLVNGVVRRILREKDHLSMPDAGKNPVGYLSVCLSHPEWLVKKWLDRFGREETEALLKANNEEAPLILRANRLKTNREALIARLRAQGIDAVPTLWSPLGIQVKSAAAVEQLPGFPEGLFQIQGEASQMIAYLVGPKPGERVLDACAAPGGKATHLAEMMENRGELIATDISGQGLEKLTQNVQRLGLDSIRAVETDASAGFNGALAKPYDRILIDAPCTGLGTLRSHPEAKWHRQEKDILRLSGIQKKLIRALAPYVKPGGILVYATCTLTAEENEETVKDFLDQQRNFALEEAARYLPPEAGSLTWNKYFLALPHRHNTDGFFAARMKKPR